jgi:putative alpha-1,2-mannosidase
MAFNVKVEARGPCYKIYFNMIWSLLTLIFATQIAANQADYTQYVNPFIGSEGPIPGYAYGGGDIFVGAAVPFGTVKVGIDTQEDNLTLATINGGYTPKGYVTGVSMLHVSGTGGCPKYGVISQMPLSNVAPPVNLLNNTTYWQRRVGEDKASVGQFSSELEDGTHLSLAGTKHAGIMRYDFPGDEKHVLVDVSHFLPDPTGGFCTQYYLDGSISLSEDGRKYVGHGTYGGGFNLGDPYTVYFCGEFDVVPKIARTFSGLNVSRITNGVIPEPTFGGNYASAGPNGDRIGALFSWYGLKNSTVQSKVGVSFISSEKACTFKDSEVPSWNLDDTMRATQNEWNTDVFGKIRVDIGHSANVENLVLLYSSLYFMHLMPSDRTGENPLWESDEPFWDDFYCICKQ